MPLKTLLYLVLFAGACCGSIILHPSLGVYAYLVTYNINPLGQWWGSYLPAVAQRYAVLLALAIGLGIVFRWGRLGYKRLLELQEVFLLLFIGIMWLSVLVGQGEGVEYNIIKMSKVGIILLMAGHVLTTPRRFDGMIWVLVLSGFYLGYELYAGTGSFRGGRFHAGVGGSDFGEGNFLAAHFGSILPFLGVLLLKGNWKARAICLVSAAFIVNAIIITRSRGIFIALSIGTAAALLLSVRLKQHRKRIAVLLVIGVMGALPLADRMFWQRINTIDAAEDERDSSAQSRLVAWHGAWQMAKDYPLGVGVGRFFGMIGYYHPELAGRDTHNTYLRCLAELGFHGLALMLLMIANAFLVLRRIDFNAALLSPRRQHYFHLHAFALKLALLIYLAAAVFVSSVYIEELYWLLLMPVFLKRALQHELPQPVEEGSYSKPATESSPHEAVPPVLNPAVNDSKVLS